ncbi:MAG TPA: ABC transporter permease subunit [Rectinemataceae bacterium]|nr:ABC transporter permease subunit [Rectinemataceae bacterium]
MTSAGKNRQARSKLRSFLVWLPLMPFFIFGVLMEIVPLASVLASSLRDGEGAFGFANYLRAMSPSIRDSFANSIRLSALTASLGVVLGSLAGYAIMNARGALFRRAATALADVATNFGGAPLAFAFIVTLGSTGIVTQILLKGFGIALYPTFRVYSVSGLVLAYLYFQIPLMILLIQPSLQGLRGEWKEAALNLGATERRYWRKVALPLLSPSLISGFFLLFANSYGAYATAWTLTGPDINLVTIRIAALVRGEVQLEPGTADAMSVLSLLIMALCVIGSLLANRRAQRWRR